MVICLERGANDLHMVQLMPLPPHHLLLQQNPEWFILLVPAYPGCPGKKAVKCLCVCVHRCTTTVNLRHTHFVLSTEAFQPTAKNMHLWTDTFTDQEGSRYPINKVITLQ